MLALAAAAALSAAPIDKKDVEYGRPGGHPLLLDLHVPDGAGPFAAAILIHGGGFTKAVKARTYGRSSSLSARRDSSGSASTTGSRRRSNSPKPWTT
jgi:hypothetical protein